VTDATVRAIRIADTLVARLGAVMRFGPLGPTDLDDFELRIGEAQQIYPEIWSHLDQARTALVARGVNTSAFDAIRAEEPKGSLGVTRVDVASRVDLSQDFLKRAQFNHEGHARAGRAVKALMDAMPEVDWKGLVREEDAEIAAVGSIGPSWKKLVAILAGLGLVGGVAAYFLTRPPDYERQHADRLAAYRVEADAHPCRKSAVDALAQEVTWKGEPEGDLKIRPMPSLETGLEYARRCRTAVAEYQRALDANPCNHDALAALERLLDDRDGNHEEAREYRSRCKDAR